MSKSNVTAKWLRKLSEMPPGSELAQIQPMMPYDVTVRSAKGEIVVRVDPLWRVSDLIDKIVSVQGWSTGLCSDCSGAGKYVGLRSVEDPCLTCGGSGTSNNVRRVLSRQRDGGHVVDLDPDSHCNMCIPMRSTLVFCNIGTSV